ncbi:MAG: hypothetical protein LAT83_20695 [Kiritimatiellae bacterium]|nr:hypothetical protein [Kiritimatiellia bacterium]
MVPILLLLACGRSPPELPYSFDGEAGGTTYFVFERVTADRKAGIVVFIDLMGYEPAPPDDIMSKFAENPTQTFRIEEEDPPITVEVYESEGPIDQFGWYHGNYFDHHSPTWSALSGEIAVTLFPVAEGDRYPRASAELKNVVFRHANGRQRRIIPSLEISDVFVGYGRF